MQGRNFFFVFMIMAFSCFWLKRSAEAQVPQQEVDALKEITSTMGVKDWRFDANSCQIIGVTPEPPENAESSINCDCHFENNNTVCNVVKIVLKGYSLPGMLPPQLVKLPQLREIDFAYNYLNGTIPLEWASTQLTFISVLVNRLSGEIPKELGNITTLTYLCLEANQFSGIVPPELGDLTNLQTLMLSSNNLTGNLPMAFAGLRNLTDFRINDNKFRGIIPDFIQNWKQLTRLEMHASGLEGPIPPNISLLNNLLQLRISDIDGPNQDFPMLRNMAGIVRLVLRNCKISGEIPAYIWTMKQLEMLDVSFNKLVGELPPSIKLERLRFLFLTGNLLSGNVGDSVLKEGSNIDLSYNNFTWQGPEQPACHENMNLNLNLFRSSLIDDDVSRRQDPHCSKNFNCPRYLNCMHVNSGGKDATIKENKTNFVYEGDGDVEGGAAEYFINGNSYWGFSSTGDFMDDFDFQNTRYTVSPPLSNISELYTTARRSPISLTYFHYCLENGNYTVSLHFAEIQFTNDKTYNSLGKRIFDIYIQEKLVWKDFNIEDDASIAQKPVIKHVSNISVVNNVLEIRFYWAGKGTTRIPNSGVYGPLISAVSVVSDSKFCSNGGTKRNVYIIAGVSVGALFLLLFIVGILWWKGCLWRKKGRKEDIKGLELQTGTFTLKQIKAATNDFDSANKIGEGGFGPVYKGQLPDGTVIAVKQLSSKSKQGNREFLNEIGMISCVQHPNLVKLHGCCIEGEQLLLVYEYMENNNLARALFGPEINQLKLDWPTRLKICIGIARGLAFLHEESRIKIVHRDIKATNVLLDGDLNPKISDFGLAKLDEEEKTHISTRVAGTIGYMAPEYALWGYLTYKADVYSFGVVALEVLSGKSNNNYIPSDNCVCLLDQACHLQQTGNLMKLIDESLGSEVNAKEAEILVKVALLCTNASASLRPTMSEVVSMLEGRMTVPDMIPEPSTYSDDLRFKAMRDLHRQRENHSLSKSQTQTQNSTTIHTFSSPTVSSQDFYEINPESSTV
uniref:non-specific serine/threonine protein kinase n=1 Tax=Quercus lobata TaxID=97700 RepID=A0A7N2LPF2_QUELO